MPLESKFYTIKQRLPKKFLKEANLMLLVSIKELIIVSRPNSADCPNIVNWRKQAFLDKKMPYGIIKS